MAGRIGWLLAFFRRADPHGAPLSGWALAFDAVVAVGAAAGAVYEMAERTLAEAVIVPGPGAVQGMIRQGGPTLVEPGRIEFIGLAHPSLLMFVGAALPLT